MNDAKLQRSTKIVATMGTATNNPDIIKKLIKTGVNVFRLNFSHGNHGDHLKRITYIRSAEKEMNSNVAILADLQGPKFRIGEVKIESKVIKGSNYIFDKDPEIGDFKRVNLPHNEIFKSLSIGSNILMDDGKLKFKVKDISKDKIKTEVIVGGAIKSNKGVNLPDVVLNTSPLTTKDIDDLKFILNQEIDWIALSFVQKLRDVEEVKKHIGDKAGVIAKIEKPSALKELNKIIEACDGIMVARGDLGVQLDLEKVPFIQKQILNEANAKGKITVTATEMLQSMKESHRPTRAEVTDITNAILEGTDCVMLSAETAIGNHPEVVVSAMSDICKEADSRNDTSALRFKETSTVDTLTTSLAKAAVQVANEIEAKAIVAFTETGRTPLLISNYRPEAPIFTMTTIDKTYNQMNILWGVQQIKIDRLETTPEMFEIADTWLQNNKKFKKNDKVVIVAGTPPNKEAATNLIRVMKIGEF